MCRHSRFHAREIRDQWQRKWSKWKLLAYLAGVFLVVKACFATTNGVDDLQAPAKLRTETESILDSHATVNDSDPLGEDDTEQHDELTMGQERESRSTFLSWLRMEPTDLMTNGSTVRGANFDESISYDKGIIICLHDRIMAMGLSLIRELRCVGNSELIQVYHCGNELSIDNQKVLVRHDNRLEIVDACLTVKDSTSPTQFRNWWLKPLAIHHTSLKEPILLDADDIVLQDPAIVRTTHRYRENGTLFFYDRARQCPLFLSAATKYTSNRPYLRYIVRAFEYSAFGIATPKSTPVQLSGSLAYQGRSCHEQDSSMVAINKTRSGRALRVLYWLITRERQRVEFSYGDKESFWLAYALSQESYAFSPWGVAVVESTANNDMQRHNDTLCGSIAHCTSLKMAMRPRRGPNFCTSMVEH